MIHRLLAFSFLFCLGIPAGAADLEPVKNAGPYVPSPTSVVSRLLRYADVGPNDFIIDLGSGDGRIVLTAAKEFGARGFGVEIKEDLVRLANEAARKQGIADRAKFLKQDLFKTDISQASVITMYLLPDTVNMLKDKFLKELRPGTRIVSHDYGLSGWLPEKSDQFDLEDKIAISGVTTTIIWLYVVPANVAGNWKLQVPASFSKQPVSLQLKQQQTTRVSGTAFVGGKEVPLEDVKLQGDRLSFKLTGRKGEFTGQVKEKSIEGTVETGKTKAPWSAALAG